MKLLSLISPLLSVIARIVGCDPQLVVDIELAKPLECRDYAIYTLFVTLDKPRTVFVLTTDVDGRMQSI